MPKEGSYWREESCGCRYLMKITNARFFDKWEQVDIEYCDEHHRKWAFIDYLCANSRQRKRMFRGFDDEMKQYVDEWHREKGLVT